MFFLLGACGKKGSTFEVNGYMLDAKDTVMYLEHLSLGEGPQAIDSVKLDERGQFSLRGKAPVGSPEFYRLRIGKQCINLGIDSTERVTVGGSLRNMSFCYSVKGSGTCDTIKLLCLKMADLEMRVRRVLEDRSFTVQERGDMVDSLLQLYKNEVKTHIIQDHYGATYSYYACFQMLGSRLVFNPEAYRSDLTWMQAVANAWNEQYPGSPRAENLANIVEKARKVYAKPRQLVLNVDGEKVKEVGIIDLTLPDVNGRLRSISDFRGKVVLP